MPNKSSLRRNAEYALASACITPDSDVFVDKSDSGQRVKFAKVFPGDATLATLRRSFAAMYPDNDTRVWVVGVRTDFYPMRFDGLAFKVFNA